MSSSSSFSGERILSVCLLEKLGLDEMRIPSRADCNEKLLFGA